MANIKIVFIGTELSKTDDHGLVLFANDNNEIYIGIDMQGFPESFICLDKSTAVSLVRELKKQIGYLDNKF